MSPKQRAEVGSRLSARVSERATRLVGAALSVTMLCVALWFLHGELAALSLADLRAEVQSIPSLALVAAFGCAVSSYFALTAYDGLALRYIGRSLPYHDYALASFMAYAVGHNVGLVTLSGGSIRYRMYSLQGLAATEIVRIVVFVALTFALGACGLLGGAMLAAPALQLEPTAAAPSLVRALGVLLAAIPVAYLAVSLRRKAPLRFLGWQLAVPSPGIASLQILISVVDLSLAAATLYVLIEPAIDIGFIEFLSLYLLALGAGLISTVPGGLGVFEAVLITALPSTPTSAALGAVIVYRLIYYVTPLALAVTILVVHEARQHRRVLQQSSKRIGDWLTTIAPQVMGALVFLAGIVLLVSGASPGIEGRLGIIARWIPLALLELSHLAGSLVGVTLLVLAHGLHKRLRAAYLTTLGALLLGVVFSLLKGLDYEEALVLSAVGIVLFVARDEFNRVGSVVASRLPVTWVAAMVCVLIGIGWVLLLSFRQVEYSNELWWQFALDGDAPRSLRAGIVATVAALTFTAWKAMRAPPRRPAPQVSEDLGHIRDVIASTDGSLANAALLGDKRFLWSPDKQAFIMYQISGDSWIALGDPVGSAARFDELVWAFRELVDRHGGRPVFYEVSDRCLPLYIDLGLTLAKLGEEGRVALPGFSLEGSRRATLRHSLNHARRLGTSFEIIERDKLEASLPELRRISDDWLAHKATAEKGFSLGAFSEGYIRHFDCAVARVDGTLVAFANLWPTRAGGEISVDLMRYDRHAPNVIMDYLFIELLLWAQAHGYRWFGLGMAPLAGMEQHALAPLWHKLGHLLFTHAESFYNFEGLRSYKSKFEPDWRPRYLACPGGWLDLPWALLDSARLIAGGVGRLWSK